MESLAQGRSGWQRFAYWGGFSNLRVIPIVGGFFYFQTNVQFISLRMDYYATSQFVIKTKLFCIFNFEEVEKHSVKKFKRYHNATGFVSKNFCLNIQTQTVNTCCLLENKKIVQHFLATGNRYSLKQAN